MNIFVIGSYVQGYCWLVPTVPKAGETLIANGLNIEAGGKGLNVAVCSQRLGAQADALFGIGEDLAGEQLKQLLQTEQIAATHTHELAKLSGSAVGMIGSNGQNAIAVLPGPNLLLNASHVKLARDAIERADIVYAQFEGAMDAIEASFEMAKKTSTKSHQAKTVLNPSPWQAISPALINLTDIIIVNEIEVLYLFNIDNTQLDNIKTSLKTLRDWQAFLAPKVQQFYAHWPGEMLVVTLGEMGCIAFDKLNQAVAIPAFKVNAIDTICCGDAFASGFCVQYLHKSLLETLTFASACGAIVASKSGMLGTLPNLNQVQEFLKTHTLQ
jgi:ribokinase